MEKNYKTIAIAAVALVGGIVIGCLLCPMRWQSQQAGSPMQMNGTNMHQMPDGSMMMNHGRPEEDMDMQSMMDAMSAGLMGKTGAAFDQAFLDEMIVHHEGAVEMAELVLQNSQRPELRTLAEAIIKAQTTEIQQMKGWRAAWFN